MPAVPCTRVQSGHDMCSVGAHTHESHARHVEKTRKGEPPCGIPADSAVLVCSKRATNSHTHAKAHPDQIEKSPRTSSCFYVHPLLLA